MRYMKVHEIYESTWDIKKVQEISPSLFRLQKLVLIKQVLLKKTKNGNN